MFLLLTAAAMFPRPAHAQGYQPDDNSNGWWFAPGTWSSAGSTCTLRVLYDSYDVTGLDFYTPLNNTPFYPYSIFTRYQFDTDTYTIDPDAFATYSEEVVVRDELWNGQSTGLWWMDDYWDDQIQVLDYSWCYPFTWLYPMWWTGQYWYPWPHGFCQRQVNPAYYGPFEMGPLISEYTESGPYEQRVKIVEDRECHPTPIGASGDYPSEWAYEPIARQDADLTASAG